MVCIHFSYLVCSNELDVQDATYMYPVTIAVSS
jgi:hypothetical protein